MLFFKIISWVVAVVGTGHAILGAWLMWYYYHTATGALRRAIMAYNGVRPVYNWTPLIAATVAWIAIYSFK